MSMLGNDYYSAISQRAAAAISVGREMAAPVQILPAAFLALRYPIW